MNLDSVAEVTRSVADQVYWYVFAHPVAVFTAFWVLFVAFSVWGMLKLRRNKSGENYKMSQRRAYLDRLYADMIGDGLAELLHQGKINSQEYRRGFKAFGVKYGLTDLMPRKTHPMAVRVRVRKNVASMKLLDASGNPIQPSIPGPKPGEVTLPPPKEPKRWVARKKLLRTVAQ
jgi:hypothetical protein